MPGPLPRGERAATPAEGSAAYRARRKATAADMPAKPPVVIRYRRPTDRRSRPQQWADAVQTLTGLLDQFEEWRDKTAIQPREQPDGGSARCRAGAARLCRSLQAVELPKGFGRD